MRHNVLLLLALFVLNQPSLADHDSHRFTDEANVNNHARFDKLVGKVIRITGWIEQGGKEGLVLLIAGKSRDGIVIAPKPCSSKGVSESLNNAAEFQKRLDAVERLKGKLGEYVTVRGTLCHHNDIAGSSRGQREPEYFFISVDNVRLSSAR